MLIRRVCAGLPEDEARAARLGLGRAFLAVGMVLNMLAILAGRFGERVGIDIGDFFIGMLSGMALVLLLASIPFVMSGWRGR